MIGRTAGKIASGNRSRWLDRKVHVVVLTRSRCTKRMEHNHSRKANFVSVWNTISCKHVEVPVYRD